MNNATLLSSDDFCRRLPYLSQRWNPSSLRPKDILVRSVEHGLMADGGESAEAEAFRLATEVGIDTGESDLLSVAEHLAALSNFIAWLVRGTQPAYRRPEPIALPDGTPWVSGAFLSQDERSLRRVLIVDRWDAWAQTAVENSWGVMGECAAYGVGMSLVIVEIGQLRKGRWSNPFTTAYRHPVSKTLRLKKRDGDDFGATWERVWREKDKATREEWLDAMDEDGVLAENLHVHSAEPQRSGDIVRLAQQKLERIGSTTLAPDPQFSQCFDKIHPCPFRSCCPRGVEPSESLGFVPISHHSHVASNIAS